MWSSDIPLQGCCRDLRLSSRLSKLVRYSHVYWSALPEGAVAIAQALAADYLMRRRPRENQLLSQES